MYFNISPIDLEEVEKLQYSILYQYIGDRFSSDATGKCIKNCKFYFKRESKGD